MRTIETQVLIIGGGITGAGIARDLSLRGIRCIVAEKKDINAGASGSNHGLLHSGARYVLHDAGTAAECMKENLILKKTAPQCIEDTGGFFVAVKGDDESYIADFPALCAAAGISVSPVDTAYALEKEPALSDKIIAAYETADAVVDPFRLSLENISHAIRLGTQLMCHTSVTGFSVIKNRIRSAALLNTRTGETFTVKADHVVNASGAWAGETARLAGLDLPMIYSKGTLIITHERITKRVVNRLRPATDADILVPGGTVSIAGTTSVSVNDPDNLHPTAQEVDLIIRGASAMVPELKDTTYIRAFSGVRPLIRQGQTRDGRSISRGHILMDHTSDGMENFITITGGKLTTYRLMAEKTADLVCGHMNVSSSCATGAMNLPAYDACRWSEPGVSQHYWLKTRKPGDLLLCECEMVPVSAIDSILESMRNQAVPAGLRSFGIRSRIGKGPCQGAYCSIRTIAYLYEKGVLQGNQGLAEMTAFLRERWKGMQPVLWGERMMHAELQEAIHCGLFETELQK
jgi:glycerol-3-phosphate dehydrogenase